MNSGHVELFEKEKREWQHQLNEARELTGEDEDKYLDLTFEQRGTLIETRIGQGKISSALCPPSINISPELLRRETSSNFKLISLSHELGEYRISGSPYSLLYSLLLRPWPKYRDRHVNKFVYKKLEERSGGMEAKGKMTSFIWEWLKISSNETPSKTDIEKYITDCMPFLQL